MKGLLFSFGVSLLGPRCRYNGYKTINADKKNQRL